MEEALTTLSFTPVFPLLAGNTSQPTISLLTDPDNGQSLTIVYMLRAPNLPAVIRVIESKGEVAKSLSRKIENVDVKAVRVQIEWELEENFDHVWTYWDHDDMAYQAEFAWEASTGVEFLEGNERVQVLDIIASMIK